MKIILLSIVVFISTSGLSQKRLEEFLSQYNYLVDPKGTIPSIKLLVTKTHTKIDESITGSGIRHDYISECKITQNEKVCDFVEVFSDSDFRRGPKEVNPPDEIPKNWTIQYDLNMIPFAGRLDSFKFVVENDSITVIQEAVEENITKLYVFETSTKKLTSIETKRDLKFNTVNLFYDYQIFNGILVAKKALVKSKFYNCSVEIVDFYFE
jgi:hypothetical protein